MSTHLTNSPINDDEPFEIQYTIWPADLIGHHFQVNLLILKPHPEGQIIQMPAWIPGSYLIRDFSKHIEFLEAFAKKGSSLKPLKLERLDNDRWRLPPVDGPVEVNASIYAFDSSVRSAYLDQDRGFFNASSLCLAVLGQTDLPCSLILVPPAQTLKQANDWQVQTTLTSAKLDPQGFGFYLARNYDDLLDHPFALGQFQFVRWKAGGVPHTMAIQGCRLEIDAKRLGTDLQAICNAAIQIFEPKTQKPPFSNYTFLVNALLAGYGGLEHRNSTALLCRRDQIPQINANLDETTYREFLGLCSHEYFHAWLVKRIQAKVFQPYHLDQRIHTRLLWLFEGFTSYYDDLLLLRSKRISLKVYLECVANNWNGVLRGAGRHKQSLADSSFDAWTKYYQSDENTPNAVVSYYAKGALLALGLDLLIRHFSQQRKSLDDALRLLWKWHGRTQKGVPEDGLDTLVLVLLGPEFAKPWKEFKARYIFGTEDIPLEEWFDPNFVRVKLKTFSQTEQLKLDFGLRFVDVQGWFKITHVFEGGFAQIAGLAPHDLLISINEQRVTVPRWNQILGQLILGERIRIRYFRQDIEHEARLQLKMPEPIAQYQLLPSNEKFN